MNARLAAITAALLMAMPFAHALAAITDTPSSATAGAASAHTIAFTTGVEDVIASIAIAFNSNFTFPGPLAATPTGIGAGTLALEGSSIVYSVTSPLVVASGAAISLAITGISNAQAAGPYTVSVTTKNATSALVEGPNESAPFTIAAGSIFAVSVSPSAPSGALGSSFAFTASGHDAYGNAIPAAVFDWATTNASVSGCTATCSASSGALFSAVAAGTANATATSMLDGSKQGAAVITVAADSTPPALTLVLPVSGSFQQSLVAFNFSSGERLTWVQLNISNSTGVAASYDNSSFTHSAGTAFNLSANLAALADGSYSYAAYGNDSSGNQGTATSTFILDKLPPALNNYSIGLRQPDAISVQKSETGFKGAYFYIYANVTEANPQVLEYYAVVRNSSNAVVANLSSPTSVNSLYRWIWVTNASTAGDNYSVSLSFKDLAGNTASVDKALYANVSNTSGSIPVSASAASICSGTTVTFSGTALNGPAGLSGWPVTIEGALSGSNATGATGYYAFSGSVTGTAAVTATVRLAYTSISGSINVSFITCTTTPTATPLPTAPATPTPAPSVSPTPQPTAASTPVPSAGVYSRDLGGSSSVTATLSAASSDFRLKFAANSTGFNGTLEYELPFDYADYSSGSLSFSPAPTSTRNGSVIASWNVSLKPNEEFAVGVHSAKPALPSILEQFAQPVLKPETAAGMPTPTLAPNSLEGNVGGFVKSQGLNIVLLLAACGVIVGGVMFYSKLKSKAVSPASAQKNIGALQGQSSPSSQPPAVSPANKPAAGLNIDFSIWKKNDGKKP